MACMAYATGAKIAGQKLKFVSLASAVCYIMDH